MFEFAWPLLFLVLPAPLLVHRFWKPAPRGGGAALRVAFAGEFADLGAAGSTMPGSRAPLILAVVGWLLLVAAAARPQWLGEPIEQTVSGRDLMLAVDLSGSMDIEDFVVDGEVSNRLEAVKRVASAFIERRSGDRIGLILFGEQAYLQVPLTFDRKTVEKLLDEAAIGLAGDKTAIGDAIGLAIKRLRDNPADQRVLILLSDGANTAGQVQPLQAAELAAREGLKIYTIGVGADEMIVRDFFGTRRVNPSEDLDEAAMTAIAEKTGGRYFRARNTEELDRIYALLDRLEPIARDARYFRPRDELYPWPLGLGLLAGAGALWLRGRNAA
ncbi:vWA domain-containing protein [Methylococcus capsulatus]|jgi:Ca-activated chloride channel family protein|uniref:Ca-activated chloride channel homolog n=1 Tax=Methylococcus capsulatus TaxID=414 RepID=A0AA35UBH1_METCP|nr:VWA domain-containing protein [Methylococcus capsulatus]QXP86514.1 VWA domain-containing protein [Methylococcus capsulatus]QXP93816.1 VWA domain-containing protein [Methylococcus capsulatus]UQN11462.1 VWA domain-containing protein [Methylococcus capsulatus]CAI8792340.1 Ca-activated chloride channel homolog [Methylococcus capsulatus]